MSTGPHGIAGAIIAGGQSSRMREGGIEGDKFLLPLGSVSVIARVAERLAPQVRRLFINANGDATRLASLNLPVVPDQPSRHGGPLVGILTALSHASDSDWLVTVAGDSPFLPRDLVKRLAARQKETRADIVLALSAGRVHPVFGLWRTSLRYQLKDWLRMAGKASVLAFASDAGFESVDFSLQSLPGGEAIDPFFNINRPDDLAEARRLDKLDFDGITR